MLHLRMNMPFALMAFYGSLMIIIVLLFRAFLKDKLPKFVFPILWCVVLLRLLVPFSLSSPLSIKISDSSQLSMLSEFINAISGDISSATAYSVTTYEDTITAGNIGVDHPDISEDIPEDTPIYQYSDVIETQSETPITITYAGTASSAMGDIRFLPFNTLILIPIIYFAGALITLVILLLQRVHYISRLKNRLLIEHNETINNILREMDMGHILVFTNDEIASPLVCGLFSPRIYLPTRMDFGNTELLGHILTHEVMHIRRKDNWIKTAMLAVLILNWFNPLVWLMSKYLSSDLETACDEAVLMHYHDEETRKSYAYSLLAMAITGNRPTLLYSAFSKTEVEKRIKSIVHYKKASAFLLIFSVAFILSSAVVFATGPQAPFSSYLTSYCASSSCRWGVQVSITRDILLSKNAHKRADYIVLDTLRTDTTNDPELIENRIRQALANEFKVETGAFDFSFSLCLDDEERDKEWEEWNLTKDAHGYFLYKGEPVRVYIDEDGGYYQSREEGSIDITVQRDKYGYISRIVELREGDSDFDRRTRE
ncbi:MAG: M56 family metallopeptidase [Lachnospiraceae bacterium]|nr:M56 family metallopeptidase [Lachnospiraceae bacterium]